MRLMYSCTLLKISRSIWPMMLLFFQLATTKVSVKNCHKNTSQAKLKEGYYILVSMHGTLG